MQESINIGEVVQLKLAQLLTNVDDYLRGNDSGLISKTAATDGLVFATTAMAVSSLGILASMTGDLPVLSTIGEIANATVANIYNAKLSLAEAVGATGAFVGLELAVIGKCYREFFGPSKKEVSGYFDCVHINGSESVEPRTEVLKSIENGTFKSQYKAIRIPQKHGHQDIKPKSTEEAATLPYYLKPFFDANASSFSSNDVDKDVETIRRLCFKEAKDTKKAQAIFNRINDIRSNSDTTKTFSPK